MKPTIVFDFGNVLIGWDPRYLYRKFFPNDQAIEQFLAEIHFHEWNLQQDRGRPFAEGVAELCAQFPRYCDLIRVYDQRWEESLSGPIWPSVEILRQIKETGYALYAISNWSAEKYHLIRPRYEFFDWFRAIIISGEVQITKPDPRVFHLLLEKIGRPAQECILIDDSVPNISVAQEIGFQVIHFHSPQQLVRELSQRGIAVSLNPIEL